MHHGALPSGEAGAETVTGNMIARLGRPGKGIPGGAGGGAGSHLRVAIMGVRGHTYALLLGLSALSWNREEQYRERRKVRKTIGMSWV